MQAHVRIENHANTDFPWVHARQPRVSGQWHRDFEAAVEAAKQAQQKRVTGENIVTDITDVDGQHYYVSQNGRVWQGWTRDVQEHTQEVWQA
jgi:hypothetical protein